MFPRAARPSPHARTWALVAGLTALTLVLGAALAGVRGLVAAAAAALVLDASAYLFADRLALRAAAARPLAAGEDPELQALVRRLAERAGVPPPRLYLMPAEQPNAFATGRDPARAAIAVTEGIRRHLATDQLAAVLAHELAHVRRRDILAGSVAAAAGAGVMMLAGLLHLTFLFGDDEEQSPLGAIAALLAIALAPLAAVLVQLAVSRGREYAADADAAALLGSPAPLADALEALDRGRDRIPMTVNPATASLYIVSPLHGRLGGLFATHPPVAERVRRLRDLRLGGAGRV